MTERRPEPTRVEAAGNATHGIAYEEPLVFERSRPGRLGVALPALDVPVVDPAAAIPPALLREDCAALPEVSEVDVVRHFTRMSTWNAAVDIGLYPLGSCTMKYNPKLNERGARLPGFAAAHPMQPDATCQGLLALQHRLEAWLAEVSGMDRVSLQPAAGAQGELAGVMMIRAYHAARGQSRTKILVPESAHGTNPASAALNGYAVVSIPAGADGILHPETVAAAMDEDVAALMITNPNTLGIFERHIGEICDVVHAKGGLVYGDGANLNAMLGVTRPGDQGIDVMHFNLHKTFSTPHGGGGPGAGPVGVKESLAPFLPAPVVRQRADGAFELDFDRPKSIGRLHGNHGNVGMLVRAYAYIRSLGPDGLRLCAEMAVLNANYLLARLRTRWHVPLDQPVLHECVLSDRALADTGVSTIDVAKRLIDYGYHPPTIYFPLVVQGALMIEPTESESREDLDRFVAALLAIEEEARTDPELVRSAPHRTRLARLDETRAARRPVLRWQPEEPPAS
jgi:glycine dehydrogenase subunit 2